MSGEGRTPPEGLLGSMHPLLFAAVCIASSVLTAAIVLASITAFIDFIAPAKSNYGDPWLALIAVLIGLVCPPTALLVIRADQKREGPISAASRTGSAARISKNTSAQAVPPAHSARPVDQAQPTHAQSGSPPQSSPAPPEASAKPEPVSSPPGRGPVPTAQDRHPAIWILVGLVATLVAVAASLYIYNFATSFNDATTREKIDWQAAQREGTSAGYEAYLKAWPRGSFAGEASRKIPILRADEEESLWRETVQKDTEDGYRTYLQRYPNGRYAATAIRTAAELASMHPLSMNEEASLRAGAEFQECRVCPKMVVIPRGQFVMGSSSSDVEAHIADQNEAPAHAVTIPEPFAVGKFELTFDQWDACVAAGGCRGYRPSDE